MKNQTKVILIGSGISGICQAITLQKNNIKDFLIIEKNDNIGGTWKENIYPGCKCDILTMVYSFSFEQSHTWTSLVVPHSEILSYLEKIVDKYNLRKNIVLNTMVIECWWDEAGVWNVKTLNTVSKEVKVYQSKYVVSCVGQLNTPSIPEFPNLANFKGKSFHSAQWDPNYDISGKKVALIGSGASALQILPNIVDKVSSVKYYQRSPNYVINVPNIPIPKWLNSLFKYVPFFQSNCRNLLWMIFDLNYRTIFRSMKGNLNSQKNSLEYMRSIVKDPVLQKKVTPDYTFGCRRILMTNGIYYQAVINPKVELIVDKIKEFTTNGVRTADNTENEVDLVIFATGFQTHHFLSKIKVIGRNGQRCFQDESYEAYKGICVPMMPNFFMLYGPNTNLNHHSIIFMIECQSNFILNCIRHTENNKFSTIEVEPNVCKEYNVMIENSLKNGVLGQSCRSWYQNAQGRNIHSFPFSTFYYWYTTRSINFKKEFLFTNNRKKQQ